MSRSIVSIYIEKAKLERGYSYQQIATACGVKKQTVYNWVKDISQPTRKNLKSLSKVLHKPEEYFFGHATNYEELQNRISDLITNTYNRDSNPAPSDEIVAAYVVEELNIMPDEAFMHFRDWKVRDALRSTRPLEIPTAEEKAQMIDNGKNMLGFERAKDRLVSFRPIGVSQNSGSIEINNDYKTFMSNGINLLIRLYCEDVSETDFRKEIHGLKEDPQGWMPAKSTMMVYSKGIVYEKVPIEPKRNPKKHQARKIPSEEDPTSEPEPHFPKE